MAKDIRAYIIQKIKEYDPTIDTRDQSAIIDLLVNPLATILGPYDSSHEDTLTQLSLKNPDILNEDEMDLIAANFLVDRVKGSKTQGQVKVYFSAPQDFSIPARTRLETDDGLRFFTINPYSITSTQMLANIQRFPLYSTDAIAVQAENEGDKYNVAAGAVTKIFGTNSSLAYVTNPVGFSSGVAKETNQELYDRLVSSIINETIASPDGIAKLLHRYFPAVMDIRVIGMTDDEMIRDLAYNTSISGLLDWNGWEYYESDFFGCISGYHEYPYNKSVAYEGLFVDDPGTEGYTSEDMPTPFYTGGQNEFTKEFTQDQYSMIFRKDDQLYMEVSSEVVLQESFGPLPTDNEFYTYWTRSDANYGLNRLVTSYELTYDENQNAVRLGYTYNSDLPNLPVLPPTPIVIGQIIELLERANS